MNTRVMLPAAGLHGAILHNPLAHLHDERAMLLFRRALALKMARYGAEYGDAVLPVDTGDFVGTHLLLCETDERGNPVPVIVARALTLRQCRAAGIGFPPVDLLHHCEATQYLPQVEQAIARADAAGADLLYLSSWAAAGHYRTSAVGPTQARDCFMAMVTDWYFKQELDGWLAFAVHKFKSDRHLALMGAQPASDVIRSRYRNNEPATLMKADTMSDAMRALAARHGAFLANTTLYKDAA